MATQSQRGHVKEHIARSILQGSFGRLHAGNLRNKEIDYIYFKINRIEHFLVLSSLLVDIEYGDFQHAMNAEELLTYELDRVSNTIDQGYCTQKLLISRIMDL